MNTFASPCRIRGQRPLTAWVLAAFVATATLLGFGARASAQELSIPVMVQTRPQVPGARFALDGTEFVANQHGLAVTTVAEPGIYELAVLSPRVEVGGTSHSFSIWTGGERVSSRPLEVGSFTLLEAGFDTTRAVSFRFADQSGTAIEPGRVDHASIGESDGDNRYRLNGTQPTRVLASRAVPNGTEVELQPVSYRLIEAVVDGRYVYDLGSDIEVGVDSSVAIPVALSTEPREGPVDSSSSASNPVDEAGGAMPWAVPVLFGLLAVMGAAWLWRARFETPGWHWIAWQAPAHTPRASARDMTATSSRLRSTVVSALMLVSALTVGIGSLVTADQRAIGPYGLIHALPPSYYLALALTAGAFLISWGRRDPSLIGVALSIVVLVLLLQAAPAIIETLPRFATGWLTAGFSDFVARSGRALPLVDARFSWPAFFAGSALISRVSGLPSAIVLLRWWPLVLNLLYLGPLFLIARRVGLSEKASMLVCWLFPLANWVGQDYYSPQSIGYLLYLSLLVVTLGQLGDRRMKLLPVWLARQRAPKQPPAQASTVFDAPRGQTTVLLSVMLLLDVALVAGHQLSPVFAIATVALLAFFGRTRLRVFPGVMFMLTLGWICYGATAYWSGHFGDLFGGLGGIGANVSASLESRFIGTPAHHRILQVRLATAVGLWSLAVLGFFAARRMDVDRRAAAILMAAPFSVLAGQSYGGEAGLRVFLFSIPGALCLAAAFLTGLPTFERLGSWFDSLPARTRNASHSIAVAGLFVVMVPAFLLARWGNELYEMTRPKEVASVRALYAMAPRGSVLVSITPQVSWRFERVTMYRYEPSNLEEFALEKIGKIEDQIRDAPAGYVLVTTGQLLYGQQVYGFSPTWGDDIDRALLSSGNFSLVYSNADAKIYQYVQAGS
ncbi:hypothetical protein BH20ACT21_BH20ACT21_03740 [soil metagenome]